MISTLFQDLRYALRQLKKTPGFTATAMLTLALGIGANAAIFTLVNALLMRNLPVADPKTLVRIGDNDDCCVSGGPLDNGDYTMFPTETWKFLQKNAVEFEELAAMQAGFTFRPIVARRDGDHARARTVAGEFVSGNYFRTFGLRAHAGRLLTDRDDRPGAPLTAVMSYAAWVHDYVSDPSVVGGTFWINTKPVTIVGIAPAGFYGDRIASTPPDFYLPIEAMPAVANVPYVHVMVMRGALIETALGLAIGVPASLLCVRFIQSQLFDMKGMDVGVLAAAIVTLVVAASLAGAIPARRAASIDPARALRTE